MPTLPHASDIFMIGLIPNPKDLEIARVLGWYRIPLRAPIRVYTVDYLAFYQPASFNENKWQIEYYAPVLGHELVFRSDLLINEPDHPHANDEYFKLQLGALQRLPSPIKAEKWKRVTFIYTNGEQFLTAKTLKDLKIQDPDEQKVFAQIMHERAEASQQYRAKGMEDFSPEIDYLTLIALLGGEFKGE